MITQLKDQLSINAEEMKKVVNGIATYKVPVVAITPSAGEEVKSSNNGLLKVGLVGGVVGGLGLLVHGDGTTWLGAALCVVGAASGYMLYQGAPSHETTTAPNHYDSDPTPFNSAKTELYKVFDHLDSTWKTLCETQAKELSDYCDRSSANTVTKTKVYDLIAMRQSLRLGSRMDYEISINRLKNHNDISGLNAQIQEFKSICQTEIDRVVEERKKMYDQISTLLTE